MNPRLPAFHQFAGSNPKSWLADDDACSASLASLTRETGPKLVKGDPARKADTPKISAVHHHYFTPTISISDSALKFTHVLYNLSPAGNMLFPSLSMDVCLG